MSELVRYELEGRARVSRPTFLTSIDRMLDAAPRDWWQYVPCGYCNAARQQPCQATDGPANRVHVRRYRAGLLLHGTFWLLANYPEDVLGK